MDRQVPGLVRSRQTCGAARRARGGSGARVGPERPVFSLPPTGTDSVPTAWRPASDGLNTSSDVVSPGSDRVATRANSMSPGVRRGSDAGEQQNTPLGGGLEARRAAGHPRRWGGSRPSGSKATPSEGGATRLTRVGCLPALQSE